MGVLTMSFWEPCWACRVIEGEVKAGVVTETSDVIVVINPFPLANGHTLVMPKVHVSNVYELPERLAGPVLAMASRIASATKAAYQADGITLRQNNDAASDQHLFHFHLHVIPRFNGDAEHFGREPELVSQDQQWGDAEVLRRSLHHGV